MLDLVLVLFAVGFSALTSNGFVVLLIGFAVISVWLFVCGIVYTALRNVSMKEDKKDLILGTMFYGGLISFFFIFAIMFLP